ncbi:spindle and centriole-associated protein 1 [Triplophysa dalaica]|uniref:spindle and centriole-associated protein 1 n=1 Tax=Triplophysa dalaica TaxID=1582913 RepID=UPI0024DFE9A3|nr:spindle and centriole-associated protein 1 [Triplophysa dalaica]XP_056594985.1 spindle and centriole-associated protein 1 [Triplophysa dalaica]
MSLVRMNRHLYGQRPVRTKKVSAPKKEWVSTVNDLSVHKATPDELARRHEKHRSQNRVAAQWELRENASRRRMKNQPPSPPGLDKARLNIIREVFSDQCQLRDVIARSDKALALVKDLFGDEPRRHTGFPTITMAPDCDSDSDLPVQQRPDPPTQLSLLSQSMMDQQALNELEEFEEEYDEEDLDTLEHFSSASEMHRKRNKCRTKSLPCGSKYLDPKLPRTPRGTREPKDKSALNATVALQRLKSSQTQPDTSQSTLQVDQVLNPESASTKSGPKGSRGRSRNTTGLNGSGLSSLGGNQSSLELLQSMLEQVENELDSLDPQEPSSSEAGHQQWKQGLTGFSVALVSTVGRLASHLRKKEEQSQQEAEKRRKLEEVLKEQRALIDALTVESLTMRDETAALQVRFQQQVSELEQRLDAVVLVLGGSDSAVHILDDTAQKGGYHETVHGCIEKYQHVQQQDTITRAVLLSPPRQRDGLPPAASYTRSHAPPLPYSGSCTATGSQCSLEDLDIPCSSSSYASLPRPTPLLDFLSQDARIGDVVEFTHQNAEIQAQLDQNRPTPAGASVSREESATRLSSTSFVARPASDQQHTQQPVCVQRSSTTDIEQKLQELNRQTAEARAKLLELIEQQKQSSSLRVSPVISPVPHHSTSIYTAVKGLTPEPFLTIPERNHSPQPTVSGTSSAGRLSPQSLESLEIQGIQSQVGKVKGEGWFALSAHVK